MTQLTRVLVRIESIDRSSNPAVISAVISAWDSDEVIKFALRLLNQEQQNNVTAGDRFFAKMNLDAERVEDIHLEDFEIAETPTGKWALVAEEAADLGISPETGKNFPFPQIKSSRKLPVT